MHVYIFLSPIHCQFTSSRPEPTAHNTCKCFFTAKQDDNPIPRCIYLRGLICVEVKIVSIRISVNTRGVMIQKFESRPTWYTSSQMILSRESKGGLALWPPNPLGMELSESTLSPGPLGFRTTATVGTFCGVSCFLSFLSPEDWEEVLPCPLCASFPKILSLAAWYLASRSFRDSDEEDGGGVGEFELELEGRLSIRIVGWKAPKGGDTTWCDAEAEGERTTDGIGFEAFAFLERD